MPNENKGECLFPFAVLDSLRLLRCDRERYWIFVFLPSHAALLLNQGNVWLLKVHCAAFSNIHTLLGNCKKKFASLKSVNILPIASWCENDFSSLFSSPWLSASACFTEEHKYGFSLLLLPFLVISISESLLWRLMPPVVVVLRQILRMGLKCSWAQFLLNTRKVGTQAGCHHSRPLLDGVSPLVTGTRGRGLSLLQGPPVVSDVSVKSTRGVHR